MPQTSVSIDSNQVRERREGFLLTQEELAAKAKIHPNTLANIEAAKPNKPYRASFGTIKGLAKALKCPPAALLLEREEVA